MPIVDNNRVLGPHNLSPSPEDPLKTLLKDLASRAGFAPSLRPGQEYSGPTIRPSSALERVEDFTKDLFRTNSMWAAQDAQLPMLGALAATATGGVSFGALAGLLGLVDVATEKGVYRSGDELLPNPLPLSGVVKLAGRAIAGPEAEQLLMRFYQKELPQLVKMNRVPGVESEDLIGNFAVEMQRRLKEPKVFYEANTQEEIDRYFKNLAVKVVKGGMTEGIQEGRNLVKGTSGNTGRSAEEGLEALAAERNVGGQRPSYASIDAPAPAAIPEINIADTITDPINREIYLRRYAPGANDSFGKLSKDLGLSKAALVERVNKDPMLNSFRAMMSSGHKMKENVMEEVRHLLMRQEPEAIDLAKAVTSARTAVSKRFSRDEIHEQINALPESERALARAYVLRAEKPSRLMRNFGSDAKPENLTSLAQRLLQSLLKLPQ